MKNRKKLFRLTAQVPDRSAYLRAEIAQKERERKLHHDKLMKRLDDRRMAEAKHRARLANKKMDDFAERLEQIKQTAERYAVRVPVWPSWIWGETQEEPVFVSSETDLIGALVELKA